MKFSNGTNTVKMWTDRTASSETASVGQRASVTGASVEWRIGALPAAVASVSVTHNGSSLAVWWDAPERADSYWVTCTDNIDWQRFATNHVGTGAAIATGVDAAESYIVGIMARNAAGNSAWVNSAATACSEGC